MLLVEKTPGPRRVWAPGPAAAVVPHR